MYLNRVRLFALALPLVVSGYCVTTPTPAPIRPVSEQQPTVVPEPASEAAESTVVEEGSEQQPGPAIVNNAPDRRGRPVTTTFSGFELIRENVLRDGLQVTRVTIRGNARIRHGGVDIRASRMAIEDGRFGALVGSVQVHDLESGTRIYGANATYNRDEQIVHLVGDPYMVVPGEGNRAPALVSTTRMTRDLAEKKSILDGDVRIRQDTWSLIGDRGEYTDENDTIVLEANPVILGLEQFMIGQRLVYEVNNRTIRLDGRVVHISRTAPASGEPRANISEDPPSLEQFARRPGQPTEREPGEPGDGKSVLSADQVVYRFPAGAEVRTRVQGEVLLTRGGFRLTAAYLDAIGQDFGTIRTAGGVDMRDSGERVRVVSNQMLYDRNRARMRLEGLPVPFIEFYAQDAEIAAAPPQATLYGSVIERDFDSRETLARGNVRIVREAYEASAETARYDEEAGIVLMQGNTALFDGRNRIQCEKIFFYPDENRILLHRNIRGTVGFYFGPVPGRGAEDAGA